MVELCVLLWANEGRADELVAYEDAVLALLPDHGGRVLSRVRTVAADGPVASAEPLEIHLIGFPSEDAVASYLADERRLALAEEREAAIERTQLLRVTTV